MRWKDIHEVNRKKILAILALALIIGVIFSYKLITTVINENAECMGNPFVYNAERLYDRGMEINCECYALDPKYNGFSFNRHNITIHKDFYSTGGANMKSLRVENSSF